MIMLLWFGYLLVSLPLNITYKCWLTVFKGTLQHTTSLLLIDMYSVKHPFHDFLALSFNIQLASLQTTFSSSLEMKNRGWGKLRHAPWVPSENAYH